jgi:hypothetical protein
MANFRFRSVLAGCMAAAIALAGQGCGSSTPDGGGNDTGTIALSLSTTSGTAVPGGQTVLTGTVSRSGGYSGTVSISVTGTPAGVTGGVGTINTTGTTSTAIISILVASTAAPGTYTLVAHATGTGVTESTVSYTLTISATAQVYALAVAPTGATVAPGASTTAAVTISRSGFSGSVNLSVPNLPTGFTATFAPNNTTDNASTVTIGVPATAAPGVYQLTIGGVAAGQQDKLTFFSISVPASGSYGVSVAPASVSVVQGSSNTATVSVSRSGGFSGNVGLTASESSGAGLLTPTFSPALVSGASSTLTLSAAASLAVGSYTVTIHGSASGFTSEQTATLSVNVTASGTGTGNAVLNFASCASTLQPVWFAYQDGTGAWTRVSASNSTYTFPVTQSKVGFAYVNLSSATQTQMNVVYYSKAELTGAPIIFCSGGTSGNTISMSGTVAGLSAGQQATVSLANSTATVPFGSTNYSLTRLPAGTFDLFALRTAGTTPTANDRIIVHRNQVVPAGGGSLAALDFGSSEAVAPAQATITLANAGAAQLTAEMVYYTGATCTSSGLLYFLLNPAATFTAFGVPSTSQLATDYHGLLLSATTATNTLGDQEFFHTLSARTVTLPTPVATPTVTTLTGNYKRLQAVFSIPSEYNNGASLVYYDATGTHTVAITATAGYLGSSSATLATPVFTGVAGFLDSYGPATSVSTTWGVQVTGSNLTGGSVCQDGGRLLSDQVSGTI